MRLRNLVGCLATIGLSACHGPDRATASPDAQALADQWRTSAVVASANGSGCFDLSGAGLGPGCIEVNAVRFADGTAGGDFRMRRPGSGGIVDFAGRLVCFVVDAASNRAWVGAKVTQNRSTDPAALTDIHEPGDDVWFRIVDYSDIDNAGSDRTTVLGFEGSAGFLTSIEYCEGRPWPAGDARTWPLFKGDLQVRP
jgi:hypothetical protein